MWETPVYKIKLKDSGCEVPINVTHSAPHFDKPGRQIKNTFDVFLRGINSGGAKVLDFGAAKFTNTLYLLERGFNVYSCEFEEILEWSKRASAALKTAERYPNFGGLIRPKDFARDRKKFDIILMINVTNVMPLPPERALALSLCREKIEDGGRLLWYTRLRKLSMLNYPSFTDGVVTGKRMENRMFYHYFSPTEVLSLLHSEGFERDMDFKFPDTKGNLAYVFRAGKNIIR